MLAKKANQEIAILILVVLTLFLVTFSLFVFTTSSNNLNLKIFDSKALEKFYTKEERLNFYIQNIVDSSAKGIDKNNTDSAKLEFESKLKRNFGDLKKIDEFSSQYNILILQINQSNINLENNALSLKLNIIMDDKVQVQKDFILVSHSYDKTFYDNL